MYETFGFEEFPPRAAAIVLGLAIGLAFGALAYGTAFCFRRALVGQDRREAAGVWLTALAVAVVSVQLAVAQGWIAFDEHRFMASELPVAAIVIGGLMFGAGMVLARGCVSRLTVLSGTGNLRALLSLAIFAIVAHAMLKGVLAPVRTAIGEVTLPIGEAASLAALPGGAILWTVIIAGAALLYAVRSGAPTGKLALAALIGLLPATAWVGTGFVLLDEFDPIPMESLAFTSPWTDSLFWSVAASAIPASFGVGLVGGVLSGSFAAAALTGGLRWQSFASPAETGRYSLGAALMGVGGVLAGGCTVGAGLSGIPTLSVAAILAVIAIAGGALATNAWLKARGRQAIALVPAE